MFLPATATWSGIYSTEATFLETIVLGGYLTVKVFLRKSLK